MKRLSVCCDVDSGRMKKSLSTSEVARLLGVTAGSVANWIDRNRLKAGRTPGGHRRIVVSDLVDFLKRQKLPIPPELIPSPARIVIVDDDASVTKWIAAEIKAQHPDFEVLEAHDGFSAGEIVGARKPDVVVLDLLMPGIDGYEVCRRIKATEATKHAAVLAITGHPSPEAEKQILECGAQVCLSKPLDTGVLLNEVEAAIKNRR